jgi:chromosome segregation ATPase
MQAAILNTILSKIQTVLEQYMQLENEYIQLLAEREQQQKTLLNEQQTLHDVKKKFDLLHLSLNVLLLENAAEDSAHQELRKQIEEIANLLSKPQIGTKISKKP